MSDKVNSITIVFEKDIYDRDADKLMELLLNIRGVISATGNVTGYANHVAEMRATQEVKEKLYKLIKEL